MEVRDYVALISVVLGGLATVWKCSRMLQEAKGRIDQLEKTQAAVPTALELEKVRGQVALKADPASCVERHRVFDQQIADLKKSISGTGVQVSVQAQQARLDALGKEVHDRITSEVRDRSDAVHSLAQDVKVLQNGAAFIAAAKESLESHMFEQLGILKALETQVSSLQRELDKLERRLHETELSLARAGGK
jgi:chromosome segregation ATPase